MKRVAIYLMIIAMLLVSFSYGCVKRAPGEDVPATLEEMK